MNRLQGRLAALVAGVLLVAPAFAEGECAPGKQSVCAEAVLLADDINAYVAKRGSGVVGLGNARASGSEVTVRFEFLEKGEDFDSLLKSRSIDANDFKASLSKFIDEMICKKDLGLDFVRMGGAMTAEVPNADGSVYLSRRIDHCP